MIIGAVTLVVAIVLSPVTGGMSLVLALSLWQWIAVAIAVSVIAVGADIKWLQSALVIGGLLASFYIAWLGPAYIAAGLANAGVGGLALQMFNAFSVFVGTLGIWGKIGLILFSAWNALGTLKAINEDTSWSEGIINVASETVGAVVGVVSGVVTGTLTGIVDGIGDVIGGIGDGVGEIIGAVTKSPLGLILLGLGAWWLLSSNEEPAATLSIENPAQDEFGPPIQEQ